MLDKNEHPGLSHIHLPQTNAVPTSNRERVNDMLHSLEGGKGFTLEADAYVQVISVWVGTENIKAILGKMIAYANRKGKQSGTLTLKDYRLALKLNDPETGTAYLDNQEA